MHVSRRLPPRLEPTPLVEALRAHGDALDLTESNPARCGLAPDADTLRETLAPAVTADYDPDPRGDARAREALAAWISERRAPCGRDALVLTASTSEAYGMVLKVFCDPGELVATPLPGYPLVEHLAQLEGVTTVPYRFVLREGRWHLDLDSVREVLEHRPRVLVVVSPSNPIGATLAGESAAALRELCREAGVVLLSDEVFGPYGPGGQAAPTLVPSGGEGLVAIALEGLSKSLALPGLKLSWMRVAAPPSLAGELLRRLEWVADLSLSVNTLTQRALPGLLELAGEVQARINMRLETNREVLREVLAGIPCAEVPDPGGGWYGVVRLPCEADEEDLVRFLAAEAGVLVHPGFYYDFLRNGHLVLSLLPETRIFREGMGRIANALAALEERRSASAPRT